jgi:uncharacterized protein (TIGR03435 family)
MNPIQVVLCSTRSGSLRHKLYKTVAPFLLVIAAVLPACAQGQAGGNSGPAVASAPATPQARATTRLAFDAASVRPSSRKFETIGGDFLDPTSQEASPKGGLFSWNVQLQLLIDFAYDLRSQQVARGAWEALPKWAHEDWYTIEARAEGNPTRADVRQMVRSLLEDRFQIAAHVEKRDSQVYALVVSKPGLGLTPHPEGAACALSSSQVDDKRYPHAYPPYKTIPARCGMFNRQLSNIGERRFEMLNMTMSQIADSLGVVDNTGLKGSYDAVLDFGPPDQVSPNAGSATSDELGLPPLPVALEKQLGLKLVKQNAKVDVFVIDHIGALSEN